MTPGFFNSYLGFSLLFFAFHFLGFFSFYFIGLTILCAGKIKPVSKQAKIQRILPMEGANQWNDSTMKYIDKVTALVDSGIANRQGKTG